MKNKLMILAVAVLLLLAVSVPASAADFADVSEDAWYFETIDYVAENGLMNGLENNNFGPEEVMDRAMVVTVLYRMVGEPAVTGDDEFTDTVSGQWYSNAEPATRAQAAATFMRLHERAGEFSADQPNETQANETQALCRMKITVGDTVIYATLANNPTADAIAQRLPLTLNMLDLYGREMCYRFDDEMPTDDVQTRNFELGEIIYWPPRHSFVIMYHQDGEVFSMQHVGNLENPEDVSLFGQGNVTVTYELVD